MNESIDRIADRLNSILANPSPPPRSALDAISELARPPQVASLLNAVLADDSRTESCARLSYPHALGFDKLVLIDGAPTFSLRIHVWWPDRSRVVEHIHNHRFMLASAMLVGGYEMETFQQADEGEPVVEYVEQAGLTHPGWSLEPVRPARLRHESTSRLQTNSSYVLHPLTLHRITVDQNVLCITMFLETASVRSTTQVFVPQGDSGEPLRMMLPFTPEAFRARLRAVQAVIVI